MTPFPLQLCHTLKLDDDTLPALTSAVVTRIEQLREEKRLLEVETSSEMNRLHEELTAAVSENLQVWLGIHLTF